MVDGREQVGSNGSVSRRRYLGLQAAIAAGLAGCNAFDGGGENTATETASSSPTGAETDEPTETETATEERESPDAAITLDVDERGERTVPDTLFGRFAEHYGEHEIYPGIYAEHVRNVAFVDYMNAREGSSYVYSFEEIGTYDGVPFPWHPVGDGEYELPDEGGVRGYGTWNSEGSWPVAGQEEANAHQRVTLDGGEDGVGQRLVLPDWRTLTYEFALSARSAAVDAVEVRLASPEGDVLASRSIEGITGEWGRFEEVTLELSDQSPSKYRITDPFVNTDESPYGEYVLEIVAEGTGRLDLDWVSLLAGDAVEGKFNPTTVDLMEDRNTTLLKWPGGNVTSTYHWEDGVGPHEERPIRPNLVWDGIDPNAMGTAEYVEFCELTDVEATVTVGVTVPPEDGGNDFQPLEPITAEDAANWVEYCNGDSEETEYGAIRAEHGYEEPFDVEVWEVGNEVWGGWQAGGTQDAETFAEYAAEFARAMREVDDSITIYADGMDPKYDDPNLPDPVEWNRTVVQVAGEYFDGIGHHRYNWGIWNQDEIQEWKAANDADGVDYSEVLVTFPTQFGQLLAETSEMAESEGFDDFEIVVGEWGLFPTVARGEPWPGMDTMAGAAYVAGTFNAFIRQSDTVRRACHTHLPVRMIPPSTNPLQPVGFTLKLYASVFDGDRQWEVVDAPVDGGTRDVPETGHRIRAMEDVPYVDATAMATPENGALCAFVTNRNLRESGEVTIEVPDAFEGADATVTAQRPTGDPHDVQSSIGDYPASWYEWTGLEAYEIDENEATIEDGALTLRLEPSAVARVLVE